VAVRSPTSTQGESLALLTSAPPLEVPVALIVFGRPDQTRRVFEIVAQARPRKLFIIGDAAREGRDEEVRRVEEVRRIISAVHWDCDVQTNFADMNIGARRRVISGIDWVFQHVEEAIILEDDILPDASFFPFCAEMLERFRNDSRVAMVGGFNVAADSVRSPYSYCFSEMSHIWGWATWRDRWSRFDENLSTFPEVKSSGLLEDLFYDEDIVRYWEPILTRMHDGTGAWDAWDYQWIYTNLTQRGLCALPTVNLIENVGYDQGATHTKDGRYAPAVSRGTLTFPLQHPPAIIASRKRDRVDYDIRGWSTPGIAGRIVRRVSREFRARFIRSQARTGTAR
jgi:hypothetical protein